MIRDGITINARHSYRDFGLYVKDKKIGLPSKRMIRESVPYRNGYYDFTAMNGAPTWLERSISYTFDVLEENEQAMNRKRDALLNWLMNAHETEIYDDTMPGWHFYGSYDGGEITDDEEASEISVSFICYPFRIANTEQRMYLKAGANTIVYSGQPVKCSVLGTSDGTIGMGGYTQSFTADTRLELLAMLMPGETEVTLTAEGTAALYYTEEIL